ncbi:MAG: pyridoxamine 5'-phosphate oxidase family protein [Candidatus Hodarchaeales archaeon]|jgi:hypothetical protein
MNKKSFDFDYVENQMRMKTFGILSTITKDNHSHSTGILFAVTPAHQPFRLYCVTGKKYKKTRNIEQNPHISFVIPFPHYYIRFVPSSCIQFQGEAKVVPFSFEHDIIEDFYKKRILKKIVKDILPSEMKEYVFIEIIPKGSIFCHGIGFSIREMRKNHAKTHYKVKVPENRL